MNAAPGLDARYLDWLYAQVAPLSVRNPARSHFLLCEQMFRTPFVWKVRNDDNRAEDARALREEFLDTHGEGDVDDEWFDFPTNMLEVSIALARHAAFEMDEAPDQWVWNIFNNLDLWQFTDERYATEHVEDEVTHILQVFIDREYEKNGRGGMFPLRHPQQDQRKVELWYQMSAYLLEMMD